MKKIFNKTFCFECGFCILFLFAVPVFASLCTFTHLDNFSSFGLFSFLLVQILCYILAVIGTKNLLKDF